MILLVTQFVGCVTYGITTGNWVGKAIAAAGIRAAICWVEWNTLGAGDAAKASHGGVASTSISSGISDVFGSLSGSYGM